jgi:esterase/lipase superfamily enzyme
MIQSSPLLFNAIVTLVGLLLYAFLWRVTRDLPTAAKVFSRIALALVVVVPLLLAVFNSATSDKSAQTGTGPAAPTSTAPATTANVPPIRRVKPADPGPAPTDVAKSNEPAAPTPAPGGTAPTRSLPVPPPTPAPAPVVTATPAPEAPKPVPTPVGDFDIVPVFYGTDRSSLPDTASIPPRVAYDSNRAKRLELGRAMVTVPRIHEVPNIERPWAYRLPLTKIVIYTEAEDPKKHFTIQEVRSMSPEAFIDLMHNRLDQSKAFKDHAIVFIHGFNTTFDNAVYRSAQISYDLKFDGISALYSWPSKGQTGLQDYGYDRDSAGQAEPHFKQFMELVLNKSTAKSVSVIAHSMGNQLLLPVLKDLKNSMPPGVQLSQVILAAPDVDRDRFEIMANDIKAFAKGMTLYAASNDRALNASMRLAGGVPRAGDVPVGGPLVVGGVDTIDVTQTSTDFFALNHSGYAEKSALLNDIQLIIQTGERPPEKRIPILERVTTPKGDYWRYPALK